MKVPQGTILHIPELNSTQDELARWVRSGNRSVVGVRADHQTAGRGRRGRTWLTPSGEALALSIALYPYANWDQPQFLGMAVALAVAEALDLLLQWPNDLLLETSNGLRKVGGVLAETISAIPIVGIGVNLTVKHFPPDLQQVATSLILCGRDAPSPEKAQTLILAALADIPEPTDWSALQSRWIARDRTAGKRYVLGEAPHEALGIDEEGRLLLSTKEGVVAVPSAVAWYGDASGLG